MKPIERLIYKPRPYGIFTLACVLLAFWSLVGILGYRYLMVSKPEPKWYDGLKDLKPGDPFYDDVVEAVHKVEQKQLAYEVNQIRNQILVQNQFDQTKGGM